MSIMTKAVIQMPYKIAFNSEYSRRQFYSHAQVLLTERDQLRAEVAGLRTGYEAYERVNAELKAENERLRTGVKGDYDLDAWLDWTQEAEALRKLAPSKEIIWCACGDGHAVNSYGAGFMDANEGVCANCDAAMGQGEQS